ncbi:MAG: exodeoxyribonuclease III [Patescibacteria group bacterium]
MATKTFISWNVNGIRAVAKKGFLDWLTSKSYDLVALQETKIGDPKILDQSLHSPVGYTSFWHPAARSGYSGVAVYTKEEPKLVKINFGTNPLSDEGRVLELDFGDFVFLNVYFPNGKSSAERLEYKLKFYDLFLAHLNKLTAAGRAVIFCGDVNTAHHEIDLARPKENAKVSGFLPAERAWIDKLEAAGFVDTFRQFSKEPNRYTWWDQKSRARDRNVGWRIDYFFVNANLQPRLVDAFILPDVLGSDHCPVGLTLKV